MSALCTQAGRFVLIQHVGGGRSATYQLQKLNNGSESEKHDRHGFSSIVAREFRENIPEGGSENHVNHVNHVSAERHAQMWDDDAYRRRRRAEFKRRGDLTIH